ncbi:AmmeMemoRadiSam system protein B [Pseudomonas sp. N040]|uniref:AmmeMemoRadiSam system protein B n=1 Tax=Pseudomonas sp. N040 TaxID=2785325 RepID=UPI0018A30F5D|nr:AmmeMemoRadiSam system protein B [Pseudomonas sp. N040]MBF7729090.1 AmmeMemoRadiSam system protein B [Pseudomonas sp. N040]MBW7012730.1 AmmeMemoRadiSam system protein B [Pseudomonas sp. N040]
MNSIRHAAVAGLFYPADPAQLAREVRQLLAAAAAPASPARVPKALIVPHAGYVYSGPIAAQAYARLQPLAGRIKRVVLLGPVHRVPVRGLALPACTTFATPLGSVPLDSAGIAAIADLPQVCRSAAAHAQEHSLEVQLPFLQEVLGEFQLVPLAVGDASAAEVAEVLERLWGGAETLVVISSDLSHYLSHAQAQRSDSATVQQILAGRAGLDHQQACGATPVNGLLAFAARHPLRAELLDLRNSGDTAGDKARVVGYGAIAFHEASAPARLDDTQGAALLQVARAAISQHLGAPAQAAGEQAWMQQPGASFVTLTQRGELRGCIGSLQAHRALVEDVRGNAVAAASRDPRFAPLSRAELAQTRIEVSLLSPSEPMHFDNEQHALAQLRPGIDGLLLEYRHARGTFLPQVWDSLPRPAEFLAQLKRKAGLPADFWHAELRLARYTVSKWQEQQHV